MVLLEFTFSPIALFYIAMNLFSFSSQNFWVLNVSRIFIFYGGQGSFDAMRKLGSAEMNVRL